jgi:enamine deaminase RidA (YjgF/YER057c/UK114 family)
MPAIHAPWRSAHAAPDHTRCDQSAARQLQPCDRGSAQCTRWLYVSGQLGIAPDGSVPETSVAQAEVCFANLLAILSEAGMGTPDLVRLNAYLVDPDDLGAYMAVRDRHVAKPPPASTLLIVHALARPQFKIEIEAIAAQMS